MENRRPYWQVAVSLLFSILATAAFIVIGIRLIGFLMPFVIGWIVASIATPLVNWLEKRMKIVKKLGSALIVILVLAAIILVSYFAVSRLVTEVTGLIRDFPDLYEQTETGLEKIGQTLSGVFVRLPEGIQNGWTSLVENLDDYMGNLMSKVSEPTVTAAGNAAKKVPYMLVLGEKEAAEGAITVRSRDKGDLGAAGLEDFIADIVYCDDHVGLFFHCAERRCHSLDERDRTRGCDKKNGYGDGQSEICSGRLF